MRTSAGPNKIYIVGKVLTRAIQKCKLLLNLSHCVKSYGHLCQIYQNHSPNMVMSLDPGFKFLNFYFSPNSVLNCRKIYHIWEKLVQKQKVTGKKQIAGGNPPPPPPVLIIELNLPRPSAYIVSKFFVCHIVILSRPISTNLK